jgi:hypothetical protein
MPTFTLVRCPKCGSTNAAEDGGLYEFAHMRCGSCGYATYCDDYQVKDDWNVEVEIAPDAREIPERLPPLEDAPWAEIPGACDACRAATTRQSIRPRSPRKDLFDRVRGIRGDLWRCKSCVLCYRHEVEPSLSVDGNEDILTRIDPATSIALLGVASGDLTAEWLDALASAPGFSPDTLAEAMPHEHPLRDRIARSPAPSDPSAPR